MVDLTLDSVRKWQFWSFSGSYLNIRVFCFECPSCFWRQLQGEGTCQKKLDVKTFLFSSSNKETQRCNGRKSRLSKLLLLVQKQLKIYNIRDNILEANLFALQQLLSTAILYCIVWHYNICTDLHCLSSGAKLVICQEHVRHTCVHREVAKAGWR